MTAHPGMTRTAFFFSFLSTTLNVNKEFNEFFEVPMEIQDLEVAPTCQSETFSPQMATRGGSQ